MERLVIETATTGRWQIGLQEYLLVAQPDNLVSEKVMAEKEKFCNEYKQKVTIKTKPHIAIASFFAKEAMEETIFRYMQRILMQQQSFEVALNNYSGFPPHGIFLRVQNQQPFKQLARQLKVVSNYVDSCSCPPVRLITNPHISIERELPETLYLKAMMDYSQKTFHETFMVNELVLLARSHQYNTYKTVQVFRLQQPAYKPFEHSLFN